MSSLINETELLEITGRWDYRQLPSNVRIGERCFLERKQSFKRFRSQREVGLRLGSGVLVYTWTEFNVEPGGSVEVGDDATLVGCVFMCAEHIRIGARVVVSYNVTIADSDFHPRDPEQRRLDAVANAPCGDKSHRPALESLPVIIEDDARIGIGAIILKGVTIGRGAWIGAGSVVARSVPPGARVEGNPGRIIGENEEGRR